MERGWVPQARDARQEGGEDPSVLYLGAQHRRARARPRVRQRRAVAMRCGAREEDDRREVGNATQVGLQLRSRG